MLRFFMLVLALSLFSCSEENNPVDTAGELGLGTFEVKIDGNDWSASEGFVFASVALNDTLSSTVISATRSINEAQTETIGFVVSRAGASLEGSYTLNPAIGNSLVYSSINGSTDKSYYSTSGTLEITKLTATNISGTFNGVCKNYADENDTITMTNGAFNAAIIATQP